MPETPTELHHAARTAARRVEKLLIEMLAEKKTGSVVVVVGWGTLEPEKHIIEKDRTVKIGRGRMEAIERIE